MKLNLEVFFFNAKTDYLPYYKNFTINIDKEAPFSEVLAKIKEQNPLFNYPNSNLWLKVNGKVISGDLKVNKVAQKLGCDLTIEPVSSYRAKNCLEIDNSDFYGFYKKFEKFCDEEDKKYFDSLYGLNYASETFNYNKNYIGDGVLVFAFHLINKNNENRDEILKIIEQDGTIWDAEFENNMFDETIDYTSLIELLKAEIGPVKDKNRVGSLFIRWYKDKKLFGDEIGVAFYGKNCDIKLKDNQKLIKFEKQNKKCGISLLETNEKMALFKAGTLLSDAYDSGADILVVEDEDILRYFKVNIGKIEKVLNREIPINLVSKEAFAS